MGASIRPIRRKSPAPIKPHFEAVADGTTLKPPQPKIPWYRTTWFLAVASSLLLWLPLSPLNWSPLAWIAPLGWLLLIREEKLSSKRPYRTIYLAGLLHWLLVVEGVRRAYWMLYAGWLALAVYLAVYVLLFVGLTRVAVHRLKLPLCLAAPTIWVGLELVRGYVATGFSVGLLGHTQVGFVPLLQIADLGGAYAVSWVVMFVAACIAQSLPWWFGRAERWPIAALVGVMVAVLAYGYTRERVVANAATTDAKSLHVVLLQNSVDTVFGGEQKAMEERLRQTYYKYLEQAKEAAKDNPKAQLMIWPESVFMGLTPEVLADRVVSPLPEEKVHADEWQLYVSTSQIKFDDHAKSAARYVSASGGRPIPQLVGTTTLRFGDGKIDIYNTALLLSPQGKIETRYAKMHLVMFGEYIPFAETFPWIYRLSPMPGGVTRGKTSEVMEVAGCKLAPNICFESTVPQLIRRQVRELAARGESPDALVSVTNDGWFWGSGLLDLHYKCAIFRAVEHRRPMLVAANTGFSTAVAPTGKVLTVGPRRAVATLPVTVTMPRTPLDSFYSRWGDVWGGACLLFATLCAGVGLTDRWRRKSGG